jgi:aspartyl/asparaginyl-tRNA synthetase
VLKEQLTTQLDQAAVALRHPRRRAPFEVAAASLAGFRAALDAQGFVGVQTPKVVASATESGSNVFALDWLVEGVRDRAGSAIAILGAELPDVPARVPAVTSPTRSH